jgi:hypothetical protein
MWIANARLIVANGATAMIGCNLLIHHEYWLLIPLVILQLLAGLNIQFGGDDK